MVGSALRRRPWGPRRRRGAAFTALLALVAVGLPTGVSARPPTDSAHQSGERQRVGAIRLLSVLPDGSAPDADSLWSAVSADGRYVAFVSKATGLVPGLVCDNTFHHLYLRDRTAGTTTLVDARPDGQCGNRAVSLTEPSISGDGMRVAFASNASDLTPVGTPGEPDVFVRDVAAQTTTTVSVTPDGKRVDGGSGAPDIAADGATVVFESRATNLVPAVPPTQAPPLVQVYRRDLTTGETTLVSATPSGGYPDGSSAMPSVSGDGNLVAYSTDASDVVPVLGPSPYNVLLFDVALQTTALVSGTSSGEPPDGGSFVPALSADGSTVAFRSDADNLVPGDTNEGEDVFAYDVGSGATTLVTHSWTGGPANGISRYADVDADGSRIVFTSFASNLVPRDRNDECDVFVYDATTGVTTLASQTRRGRSGNGDSSGLWRPAISGDGSLVSFASDATNLVRETADITRSTYQVYGYRVS